MRGFASGGVWVRVSMSGVLCMFVLKKFRDEWMHSCICTNSGSFNEFSLLRFSRDLPPVHSFPPFTHSPSQTPAGIEAIPVGLRVLDDAEREMSPSPPRLLARLAGCMRSPRWRRSAVLLDGGDWPTWTASVVAATGARLLEVEVASDISIDGVSNSYPPPSSCTRCSVCELEWIRTSRTRTAVARDTVR
jgi:hypothetical protein